MGRSIVGKVCSSSSAGTAPSFTGFDETSFAFELVRRLGTPLQMPASLVWLFGSVFHGPPAVKWPVLLTPAECDRLRVVLVATHNPLNIGAAARAMANFGFRRLRVVNPYEVAFREARSAMSAADVLAAAEQYSSVAEAVADCRLIVGTAPAQHREIRHDSKMLADAGTAIRSELSSSQVALLFGSEKTGLSNQDLSHCHWVLRIPTEERNFSMNLGQAVAVCLYEVIRAEAKPQPDKTELATAGELERITDSLLETLRVSGYVNSAAEATVEDKVRRLVHRLRVSAADAPVLLGMLKQILWRLRTPSQAAVNKEHRSKSEP